VLASANAASAAWADYKDEQEIFAVVHDAEGKPREVKIWIVVLEDNEWSQSTPSSANLAGSMHDRFTAFGLPVFEIDSTDVEELDAVAERALDHARTHESPVAIVIHTYRLCHHSKNDDNRPVDEVAARWELDPIEIHGRRLDPAARAAIDSEVESALQDVIDRALAL